MRYVSVVIAFILMVVAAVFGVKLISKQLKSFNETTAVTSQLAYSEYQKTGTKLRYSIVGPVVADENHRELAFEIGQGSRAVKLYKGYSSTLLKEQLLANNYNAYEAFAKSLFASGFTDARESQKDSKYLGNCPNGNLYTAELIDADGKTVKSLWKTSCSTKNGNLSASYQPILELFKNQFPDYKTFSSDIAID